MGFPPGVAAMSGNGGHLLFPCDLPNNEETARLFKRAMAAIVEHFATADGVTIDPTVINASRPWKVYGTRAMKGYMWTGVAG